MLIISPYFPPVNTADMQRVRMSLPYFKENGWHAEVVAVDPAYTDLVQDKLLLESISEEIKVHLVKALNKKWTAKLGFGSISYRSYWFIRKKVNELLAQHQFNLIYFSTTQFQVCTLGPYWKRKFNIPYVIDMQDPWHSHYSRGKPAEQRPPKYWLLYHLNKYLEPIAMKMADGLISVSEDYIKVLKDRYPNLRQIPSAVITFGAFEPDLKIADENSDKFEQLLDPASKNIVYIGRGGIDMYNAIKPLFETFKKGMNDDTGLFSNLRFYFIGTSYAPNGQGDYTILRLAKAYGLGSSIIEITGRIGYYHTLVTLQHADALFIPGSDDPQYTASKIFPYLLINKPILAIFNSRSSAIGILKEYGAADVYSYDKTPQLSLKISTFLAGANAGTLKNVSYKKQAITKYSAQTMARQQCDLFNKVNFSL